MPPFRTICGASVSRPAWAVGGRCASAACRLTRFILILRRAAYKTNATRRRLHSSAGNTVGRRMACYAASASSISCGLLGQTLNSFQLTTSSTTRTQTVRQRTSTSVKCSSMPSPKTDHRAPCFSIRGMPRSRTSNSFIAQIFFQDLEEQPVGESVNSNSKCNFLK